MGSGGMGGGRGGGGMGGGMGGGRGGASMSGGMPQGHSAPPPQQQQTQQQAHPAQTQQHQTLATLEPGALLMAEGTAAWPDEEPSQAESSSEPQAKRPRVVSDVWGAHLKGNLGKPIQINTNFFRIVLRNPNLRVAQYQVSGTRIEHATRAARE